jgi:uncharacterized protein
MFILFLLPTMLFGQDLTAGNWVNDYAGLLTQSEVESLNAKISAFEKKTDIEIAVAIISTLDGQDIDTYKNFLFRQWGVGKADRDNGLLLVIAPNEHKWGIEIGYGLEPYMSDWESKDLAENYLVPAFKQEAYYDGLDQFLDATKNVLGGKSWEDRVAYAKQQQKEHDEAVANFWWGFLYVVLFIIGIVLLTFAFLRFKKHRDKLEAFKIKKKNGIDDFKQKIENINSALLSFGRPVVDQNEKQIKLLNGIESEFDFDQHLIAANNELRKYTTDINNLKDLKNSISELKRSYTNMTHKEGLIGLAITPKYDAELENMNTTNILGNRNTISMLIEKYNVVSNQIDNFIEFQKLSPIPVSDALKYSNNYKISQNEKYQLDQRTVETNLARLTEAIKDFNSVELVFDNLDTLKNKVRLIDSRKHSIYNHFNDIDQKNRQYRSIVSSLQNSTSTLLSHKVKLSSYLTNSDVSSSTRSSISAFLLTMLAFKVGGDVYSSFNELNSITSKVNSLTNAAESDIQEEERKRRKKREEEARKKREEEEAEDRRRRRNSSSSYGSSYGSSWSSSSSDSSFGGFGGGDSGGGGSSGSW